MPKQGAWLRTAAVAAIAGVSLSLSALSVAQANQRADATMSPKKHYLRQRETRTSPQDLWGRPELTGVHVAISEHVPAMHVHMAPGRPELSRKQWPLACSEIIPMR